MKKEKKDTLKEFQKKIVEDCVDAAVKAKSSERIRDFYKNHH